MGKMLSNQVRGQVSIELFLAVSLFIVVAVWASNYAQVYTAAADQLASFTQATTIATTAALSVNSACAYGTSIAFVLPCAFEGGQMVPVALQAGSPAGSLNVSLPGSNVTATRSVLCTASGQFEYECANAQGEWACATSSAGTVILSDGACANINTTRNV